MNAPPRILIIDDEPGNLGFLCDLLAEEGYEPILAESAAAGLRLMHELAPEVVLLDQNMPGTDGVETCRLIRENLAWEGLPVLFLTVAEGAEELERAFAVGATDFLRKPVDRRELLARLRAHLRVAGLQRQLGEQLMLRFRLEAQLQRGLRRAVVVVDAVGKIVFATDEIRTRLPEWWTSGRPFEANAGGAERGWRWRALAAEPGAPLRGYELVQEEEVAGIEDLRTLGLTPRQAEVMYWMAEGKVNGEIAVILGASVRTVEKHVGHIYERIGVENRYAAIRLVLQHRRSPQTG